jgi:hypothetical protein
LDIALYITEEFKHRTRQHLGQRFQGDLTLSTAIVWAHTTFPFGTWLDMAESALKFAKREGAKRQLSGGLLNFLVISSTNHLAFAHFYRHVLTHEEPGQWKVERTLRPYTPEELRQLLGYRQTLRRMSRSKLAALRQAVFQPPTRAMFEAVRTLVHRRDDRTRAAIQEMVYTLVESRRGQSGSLLFPFVAMKEELQDPDEALTTYTTPIADLAELWDFIPGGSDEE